MRVVVTGHLQQTYRLVAPADCCPSPLPVGVLAGGSLLSPEALHFLDNDLLSDPPKYFLPVMQVKSCFGLTWNLSCMSHWVNPSVNFQSTLYVKVAARRHVGLFTFSFLMISVSGSGVIVSLTQTFMLSGRSSLHDDTNGLSMRPSSALIWINSIMLAFKTVMSWAPFNDLDNRASILHDLVRCSCVTSKLSNSSVSSCLCSSLKGAILSTDDTSLPLGCPP